MSEHLWALVQRLIASEGRTEALDALYESLTRRAPASRDEAG